MPKKIMPNLVYYHMKMLWYATAKQLGDFYFKEDKEKSRNLSQQKAYNRLETLVRDGRLDKIGKRTAIFRLKGKAGEGGEHALKVTDTLLQIFSCYPSTILQREPDLGIPSRPDACGIIRTRRATYPFILEVMHTEKKQSIQDKIEDYKHYKGKWFTDRGEQWAAIIVIGDIQLDEEGVIVGKEFKKGMLY